MLTPHLHQVPYGNLRSQYSRWDADNGTVANLAIVYELPGGSTDQINITYHEPSGVFSYLALDSERECHTTVLDDVLRMVTGAIEAIPHRRAEQLLASIDYWAAQSMPYQEMLQQLNRLLHMEDMRGGAITPREMQIGIAHLLARYRPAVPPAC